MWIKSLILPLEASVELEDLKLPYRLYCHQCPVHRPIVRQSLLTTPNACPNTPSNPQCSIHNPNPATNGPHHNPQPPLSSTQDPICMNIPPQPPICDLDPDDEPYPISPSTQPSNPIPTTNHQQSSDQTVALSGCTVVNCDSTNPPLSPNLISIPLHPSSSPPDFSFVIPPPLQPLSPNSQVSNHNSSGIPHTINPVTETQVSFIGATNVDVTVPFDVSPRYEVILEDLDPDLEHDLSASRPTSPDYTSAPITNPPNIEYQQPASRQPYPSDIPADPNPDNNNQSEFVKLWSSRFSSTDSFAAFSYQCDQFASAVVEEGKSKSASKPNSRPSPRRNRPNNRPVNPNSLRVLPNPIEARRLQTLYRLSKKRAARQVLTGNTTSYSGTKDQATQYFTNTLPSLLHQLMLRKFFNPSTAMSCVLMKILISWPHLIAMTLRTS